MFHVKHLPCRLACAHRVGITARNLKERKRGIWQKFKIERCATWTDEKPEGKYTRDNDGIITDLPGVYSLSPYSPEEIVTRDYLLDGGPDVVVNLVDATNLERNLYLTTQILDLGVPVVVALNMMDLVKKSGDKIDVAGLSKQLGCPIVETTALKGHGMAELMETAVKAAKAGKPAEPKMPFDAQVEEAPSSCSRARSAPSPT